MAVEYRYSQSTDDDPYQTRYHCLIGAGTSQIKFGENGLTYINGRDPGYGDGWMITAPYIILKSNETVVRTSATGSPAMMGDVNSLTSEVNNKADKLHVAVTKIEGDSPSSPTADKTYEQIMAAVQEGAEALMAERSSRKPLSISSLSERMSITSTSAFVDGDFRWVNIDFPHMPLIYLHIMTSLSMTVALKSQQRQTLRHSHRGYHSLRPVWPHWKEVTDDFNYFFDPGTIQNC